MNQDRKAHYKTSWQSPFVLKHESLPQLFVDKAIRCPLLTDLITRRERDDSEVLGFVRVGDEATQLRTHRVFSSSGLGCG